MRQADVCDPLLEARAGGDADQELELLVGCGEPEGGDEEGEEDRAEGVDVPAEKGAAEGGE